MRRQRAMEPNVNAAPWNDGNGDVVLSTVSQNKSRGQKEPDEKASLGAGRERSKGMKSATHADG